MTTATSPIANLGELARERSASNASKQPLEYQDRTEPRTPMAVDYPNGNGSSDLRHPQAPQHPYGEEHGNGYPEDYYEGQQQQQQQQQQPHYNGTYSHHTSPPPSTSSAHYPNGSAASYHQQQPPPAIQTFLMGNGSGNGVHPHNSSFASPTSPALSPSPLSPSNVHPYQQQQHEYEQAQGYHPHHAHHASYPQDPHPHPLSPTTDGNGHHFYSPYPIPGNSGPGHDGHHNATSNNGSYSSSASSTHYPRNHSFNHHGSVDEHEPESPGGFGPGMSMGLGPDGNPLSNSHGGYSVSAPSSSSVQRAKRRSEVFATHESPFFYPAQQHYTLLSMDQSSSYSLKIAAKIDRGFFLASNDWTCYRRNYFQLSASFSIQGLDSAAQPELPCLLDRGGDLVRVHRFSICIGAQIQNGEKTIELVQHTPKRDKGPQITPRPTPVSPGGDLNSNSSEANPNVITFERVQFKTATANNGKRRAAQQYYQVHVDLFAETDMGDMVLVATSISAPLVVRGRSPGHYVDSEDTGAPTSPTSAGPQRQPIDGRYSGYRNDSISSVVSGEYPYYPNYSYGSSYQYQSLGSSASHMAAQQPHDGAGYYDRQEEGSYPTSPLSPTVGSHSNSHSGMDTPQHPLHGHPYMTPLVQHGFSPESVSPDTYSPPGFVHSEGESPSGGFRDSHAQGHGGQGADQYGYPLSSYQQYQQQQQHGGHHHQPQSPYGQYPGHHHDHRDSHEQQDHETQLAGLRIHSPVSPGNSHGGSSSAGPSTPRRQSFSSSMSSRKNDHRGSIGGPASAGVSTRKGRSISMSGISKRPPSKTRPSRTVPATPTRESGNNNVGGSLSAGGNNNTKGLGITKDRIPESPMEEQMS